jgi:hypothetical protein
MCQGCVDEGRMTAEELAAATAAGDTSVLPLEQLEPAAFSQELALVMLSAMLSGMAPERAVAVAVTVAQEYVRIRDLPPDTLEEILEALAAV